MVGSILPLPCQCVPRAVVSQFTRASVTLAQCLVTMAAPSSSMPVRGPVDSGLWQAEWLRLVRAGAISSTASLEGRTFRYGLRLDDDGSIVEFCEDGDGTKPSLAARASTVGGYPILLRANRALRPPAAPKLGDLVPHDEATCSMCSGPLRLELRPMVAQAVAATGRCWDVHFNISPMEPRGHFLLVPEIARAANRRQQKLTAEDCVDLVAIGRACASQLCVNFNAPRAGASQNHLHAHAWAMPEPYPLLAAAARAALPLVGEVEAAILEWPASCVRLRGGTIEAAGAVVEELCAQCPVHNVCVIGGDTFVFVRSPEGEISDWVPGLKLGSIQLLGAMVVDSAAQFQAAERPGAVEAALRDTRIAEALPELLERVHSRLLARIS